MIDTADWAEQMCIQQICAQKNWSGIEDAGWGKGYTYLAEEFGKSLNLLEDVVRSGINVVVTAHAQMRKFEQPDELGSYDRWELKLQKRQRRWSKSGRIWCCLPTIRPSSSMSTVRVQSRVKNKAQGAGQRVMYTTHHSRWDAKNRHGLPDEAPFDYTAVAHLFAEQAAVQVPIQKTVLTDSTATSPGNTDDRSANVSSAVAEGYRRGRRYPRGPAGTDRSTV